MGQGQEVMAAYLAGGDDIVRMARGFAANASPLAKENRVLDVIGRNAQWRGRECLNLIAPEALMSPTVRRALSSEFSQRAAEGEIGDRWFAGQAYIDELEALCVEYLKQCFNANYADHRLVSGMVANIAVYTAFTQPGDTILSIAQPLGGHSSNRDDGPAGIRGLRVVDLPMDPVELVVDVEGFRRAAERERPRLVALGASMTLFPFPLEALRRIADELRFILYFDGAHQAGLCAGGRFQAPLAEGADVLTGSTGKTFSGPQGGVIAYSKPEHDRMIRPVIFPAVAATHQVNRVAALAIAAAEMLEFGRSYMGQIVTNARALGWALAQRGFTLLGAHKGFTDTHQVILDLSRGMRGYEAARLLERANIIANKNLLPGDRPADWARPGGLRLGTTEVTRLGMGLAEMARIADWFHWVLVAREAPERVAAEVRAFREDFQTVYYCFENGLPPNGAVEPRC